MFDHPLITAQETPVTEDRSDGAGLHFFETKIRPVLVQHCYECHAADSKILRGGLQLDSRDATLKGGDSGPALVAGKPEASLLIQALKHESLAMPPDSKLPDQTTLKNGSDLEHRIPGSRRKLHA